MLAKSVDYMPMRLCKLIADSYSDARIRKAYLKRLGVQMGEGTFSNFGLRVVPNDNPICVDIGKNVSLAPNIVFVCNSSANNGVEINKLKYVANKLTYSGNIKVEDEVWIGANVTVLPGINIGKCSVIGAGSVVINDVESYCVYAGVPAKKIRNLLSEEGDYNGL
ncbi:galactoside O-acetyltransferase [Aminipila terrae]|uniref:Galactoside O-acetyltransferase n=2 Tax=Aminipila terrae TaxID=2697030 RepID=A0A6P1MGS3_9FIRM|nr:galactoside O-acetyltransferase [Aminipila terrae]